MLMRICALAVTMCAAALGATLAARAAGPPAHPPAQAAPPYFVYQPYISGTECGNLIETFDGPTTDWFTGHFGSLLAELDSGEYRWLGNESGTVWHLAGPGCERVGYHAAVDAHWAGAPGNFYGLLFDIDQATGHAYILAVNSDNRVWLVFELDDNSFDVVIPATYADAVRPGYEVNRMAARREGDTIYLSINGTAVGELTGPPAAPFLAGVAAATYFNQPSIDVRYDNAFWGSQ